jgi:hypothetical protein
MDILVDKLFSIKDSLQDGILVLPQLLSGFFFFIGILTSNIGMFCLALGHFFLVPSLSFFANNEWALYKSTKRDGETRIDVNLLDIARSVGAGLLLLGCLIGSFWGLSVLIPIAFALKFALQYLLEREPVSLFDAVNPYVWFFGNIQKTSKSTVDLCYLSPEDTFTKEDQRRSPSGWIIHLLFFAGFLIANAARIYALPPPTLSSTTDAKINASNREQIDILVNNRKIITGTVIGLSILVVSALLYVQFTMTPCEGSIYESLFPMLYCSLFGVAWYTLLTDSCGIPASDILGLVQGFISPTAITNPIVCIGSSTGPT